MVLAKEPHIEFFCITGVQTQASQSVPSTERTQVTHPEPAWSLSTSQCHRQPRTPAVCRRHLQRRLMTRTSFH